jgi:hypothetical protein
MKKVKDVDFNQEVLERIEKYRNDHHLSFDDACNILVKIGLKQ